MPLYKLRIGRGFTLLAGVTRGWVPADPERAKEQARELSRARERINRQQRQIRHLQEEQGLTQPDSSGVSPEKSSGYSAQQERGALGLVL